MKLKENDFIVSEGPRLGQCAYIGYLEAGKAYGRRDYMAHPAADAAYKRGWDARIRELEETERRLAS